MSTEKFQGMAHEYAKYRPSYPENLYQFLYNNLNFSHQKIIADIGAGTGKFSLPLIKSGLKVYCIEPNKDMKDKMDEGLNVYENYIGISASAENTSLMDQSIDYIVCAQAFHWFNTSLFKQECKRILRTDNNIVLIWNVSDDNDELNNNHFHINKQYCPEFKGFSGGINKIDPYQFNEFFTNSPCNYKIFENNIFYDCVDTFIGKCLTGSYAPKIDDSNYKPYINSLKKMYEKYATRQGLVIKNNSVIYWGHV